MTRVKEQVKEGRSIQIDLPFNSFKTFLDEVYQKMETIGEAFTIHPKKLLKEEQLKKLLKKQHQENN
jgi:hypothetical protein